VRQKNQYVKKADDDNKISSVAGLHFQKETDANYPHMPKDNILPW
jgi:hypothetical protein